MKKYVMMIFFFLLCIFGLKNDIYAIESNDAKCLSLELDTCVEKYVEKNNINISAVDKLNLSTIDYSINKEDVEYLKNNCNNLENINISNCTFSSKEVEDEFYNKFSNYLSEDSKKYIASTYSQIHDSFSLSLNGICMIDKGNGTYDVGVAYESNDPQVQFCWKQYDLQKKEWSIVSNWQSGNWITWNLKNAGDYWIYVEAKTQDGQIKNMVYGHHYEGMYVKLNGICTLDKGDHIDCGVAYDTNDSNIRFKWQVYNLQTEKWKSISDWYNGNWCTWYPDSKGSYWIYVEAMLENGDIFHQVIPYYFNGISLKLNGICCIERQNSIDVGVNYNSNSSNVQFRWQIYNLQTKKWSILSDWYNGNWTTWRPNSPGDYWVYVEAKTRDGNVQNNVMGYHIKSPKIVSFSTGCSGISWLDETLHLQGNYKDLPSMIGLTRYLVFDGYNWQVLAENTNAVQWSPQTLGDYLFAYEIYDKNSKLIQQVFQNVSIQEPYLYLNDILINQKNNLNIDLDVSSSTNDHNILYKWMYYDVSSGQWGLITDWSTKKTVQWKAPHVGGFWVHVEAKVHGELSKTFTKGYTVTQYSKEINDMWSYANTFSSQTNYLILVNRNTHNVGIFTGSYGNWNLYKYWQCSDGKPSTPTVGGVFTVKAKGSYFDSGNSRCYWYTQFYGNYLFHSVLYNKDGTLQDGRLGMGLSHGCVRLDINNAKWIYDYIPVGTKVVVY